MVTTSFNFIQISPKNICCKTHEFPCNQQSFDHGLICIEISLYGKIEKIKVKGFHEAVKTFIITILLTLSLTLEILMIDLIMGIKINELLPHLLAAFEVLEPAEYFLTFVFIAYPVIKPVVNFIQKKRLKTSSGK